MKKYKVVKIASYDKAFRLRYHKIGSYVYVYRKFEKYYFVNGKRHRRGGPAVDTRRLKQWWVNGKLHREGGHAAITENYHKWYYHGELHRTNGPAAVLFGDIMRTDKCNDDVQEWWIDGKYLDQKEIVKWIREDNIVIPFDEPTQMLFLMKFG